MPVGSHRVASWKLICLFLIPGAAWWGTEALAEQTEAAGSIVQSAPTSIVTVATKLIGDDLLGADTFGRSVAISGNLAVVGSFGGVLAKPNAGAAYVFERDAGTTIWTRVITLTAPNPATKDFFGGSVAIQGDTIVVGASRVDVIVDGEVTVKDSGAAFVFQQDVDGTNAWGRVKDLIVADGAENDLFGGSVAIDGDLIVIGSSGFDSQTGDSNSGATYVFERNEGGTDAWGQVARLTPTDAAASDYFGGSVAISGETVLVGARHADDAGPDTGAAYVFLQNLAGPSLWIEVAKLSPGSTAGGSFGGSVAISGDTAVIGAPTDTNFADETGAVYVFNRNLGGTEAWGNVTKINASDAVEGDSFGNSVSISGDILVAGAHYADPLGAYSGAAYLVERNLGVRGELAKCLGFGAESTDYFGGSVSISGSTVFFGAIGDNQLSANSGAASVLDIDP